MLLVEFRFIRVSVKRPKLGHLVGALLLLCLFCLATVPGVSDLTFIKTFLNYRKIQFSTATKTLTYLSVDDAIVVMRS